MERLGLGPPPEVVLSFMVMITTTSADCFEQMSVSEEASGLIISPDVRASAQSSVLSLSSSIYFAQSWLAEGCAGVGLTTVR